MFGEFCEERVRRLELVGGQELQPWDWKSSIMVREVLFGKTEAEVGMFRLTECET